MNDLWEEIGMQFRLTGIWKRGSSHMRWEDCVKRDVRKAKEDDKWSEKAVDGEK